MKKQTLKADPSNWIRIIYIIPVLTVAYDNLYRQVRQNRAVRTFCSVIVDIFGLTSIFALSYMWLLTAAYFS